MWCTYPLKVLFITRYLLYINCSYSVLFELLHPSWQLEPVGHFQWSLTQCFLVSTLFCVNSRQWDQYLFYLKKLFKPVCLVSTFMPQSQWSHCLILMFKVNVNRSSWAVSLWFYALWGWHMIGLLENGVDLFLLKWKWLGSVKVSPMTTIVLNLWLL